MVVARPIQVGLVLRFQVARTVRFGHNLLEGVVVHATPQAPINGSWAANSLRLYPKPN